MNEVFKLSLSLSLSASILVLLMIVIKKVGKKWLLKRWIYYLWLVVFLRLLLPFGFEQSVMNQLFHHFDEQELITDAPLKPAENGVQLENVTLIETAKPDAETLQSSAPPKKSMLALILHYLWIPWLIVGGALLIYKIVTYRNFVNYVKANITLVDEPAILDLLSDVLEELEVKRPLELFVNPLIASPLLIGARKSAIVLPTVSLQAEDLRHILLHEVIHYKRKDVLYIWLTQVSVCLNWFNPMIHLMSRQIQKDRELSCDEAVIHKLSGINRMHYGDTLLRSLSASGSYKESLMSISLHEHAKDLKERLISISESAPPSKMGKYLLIVVATFLIFIGSVLGAYQMNTSPQPIKESLLSSINSDTDSELEAGDFRKLDLAGEIKGLDLQVPLANITIQTGSAEAIEVDGKLDYQFEDGLFKVTTQKNNEYDELSIVITLLEEKTYDAIQMKTENANIKLDTIQAKDVLITGDYNQVNLASLQSETLQIEAELGEITITDGTVTQLVTISTSLTDATITNLHAKNLVVVNSNGIIIANELEIFEKTTIENDHEMTLTDFTSNQIEVAQDIGDLSIHNGWMKQQTTFHSTMGNITYHGILHGQTTVENEGVGTIALNIVEPQNLYQIQAESEEAGLNKLMIDQTTHAYPYTSGSGEHLLQLRDSNTVGTAIKLYFNSPKEEN
ncbi:M56 family metallopeptidase [Isobaculum melis]|uniref:Signal transducer regulating beta-lactamase production, contains metallopeptidase domain n=1 Tax=Isobaculum melis TaxID=142588 RepID=A0A1H9R5K0_9LACT|nr:M56 family metallopeptidase [Isobaculum melis]SER67213.1 Signal transducer regulating beta-lactamase production, contains metallopeptidase domain [Isobaculum melis]